MTGEFPLNTIFHRYIGADRKSRVIDYALQIIGRDYDQESRQDVLRELVREGQIVFAPKYSKDKVSSYVEYISRKNGNAVIEEGVLQRLCNRAREASRTAPYDDPGQVKKYVLVILVSNIENIASSLGPALHVLDRDKRENGKNYCKVRLPFSPGHFSMPDNVYLVMALELDSFYHLEADIGPAWFRRFDFVTLQPDYARIDRCVDGIHLGFLLSRINERIARYSTRERVVFGPSVFMEAATVEDIADAIRDRIMPNLLCEDIKSYANIFGGWQEAQDMSEDRGEYFLLKCKSSVGKKHPWTEGRSIYCRMLREYYKQNRRMPTCWQWPNICGGDRRMDYYGISPRPGRRAIERIISEAAEQDGE